MASPLNLAVTTYRQISELSQLDYDADRLGNECDTTPGEPPPKRVAMLRSRVTRCPRGGSLPSHSLIVALCERTVPALRNLRNFHLYAGWDQTGFAGPESSSRLGGPVAGIRTWF